MIRHTRPEGLNKNLLILHFTVFIWGFTGILGALISLSSIYLVWYRVIIATCTLFLYFKVNKSAFTVDKKTLLQLFGTGAILAIHWVLFFESIKSSTVSVTLVCLSSITLFTAVFEPLLSQKKISKLEIGAGLMIILGIFLIFKFETQYTKGIITGLLSAAAASLFSIINSKQVQKNEAPVIGFYELTGALCWISLFLLAANDLNNFTLPTLHDWLYLAILGTICTAVAYIAGIAVMKEISAFRVALITNLEPIYGIIMAFVFFGEMDKMTGGFWIGAGIILSTIFLFPIAKSRIATYRAR
jgi:drug/metabolite transporter (DMT)-like permease